MAAEQLQTALTTVVTQPAPKPPTRGYKHLTHDKLRLLCELRRNGKTQTEIAQILGCDQRTVSRWLHDLTDSRDDATAYLRASALRMARNVVRKGKPDVQLKALQGLGVAADVDAGPRVVIQIGGNASDVQVAVVPPLSPSVSPDLHRLSADNSSDSLT